MTIAAAKTSGISEDGETIKLNSSISPNDYEQPDAISFKWTVVTGNATFDDDTLSNPKITIPKNDSNDKKTITVQCQLTVKYNDESNARSYPSAPLPLTQDDNGCFAKGTKILLSNGIYKNIEDLSYNDEIITWNFYTGKYESSKIAILVDHGEEIYNVLNLKFSDDYGISIIADHGLFDYDLNKFVYISIDNYKEYIGHKFVVYKNGENHTVTLLRGYIEEKLTNAYSITSAINYNVIANNMLTCPPPGEFYNFVKMGEKLRIDVNAFDKDVETYGLYDYDVFEPYGISYETFIAFNGPYLKIPVEKGIFTFDYIINLFNQYKSWI